MAQSDIPPINVDVAQTSSITQLGKTMVHKLLATGEIPSFRVGRRRLILYADLLAYMQRLAQKQRSDIGSA